jgi:hypothetical protein
MEAMPAHIAAQASQVRASLVHADWVVLRMVELLVVPPARGAARACGKG